MSYDGVGNRLAVTVAVPSVPSAFSGQTAYDAKDQLLQEQSTRNGGYANTFAYDAAGNPTTSRGVSGNTFNPDNQVANAGFAYDGAGNPTTYQGVGLAFDPENRLTQYGSSLTAGYTGDNLRAWKQGGGGRTYFLYDGDTPVVELDSSGSVTAVNTFGAQGLVSRRSGGSSVFYTFDASGSVAQRLGAAGNVLSSDLYDGFGNRQSTGGANVFGFGAEWGYYTDAETGLVLCTYRYMTPAPGGSSPATRRGTAAASTFMATSGTTRSTWVIRTATVLPSTSPPSCRRGESSMAPLRGMAVMAWTRTPPVLCRAHRISQSGRPVQLNFLVAARVKEQLAYSPAAVSGEV